MKSFEVVVPRNLIKKFYLHPEDYGDGVYVVDLINDMYTDVFYRAEGDFVTITNDKKLISYLKSNKSKKREYFFRNGVFAFRTIEDYDLELLYDWQNENSKIAKSKIIKNSQLPSKFMFCFYWIEVGFVTYSDETLIFNIYENDLISDIDIDIAMHLLDEHLSQK